MNPTSFVTSSRSSARTTSTAGPLVFQYETPQGHRYHVAGKGFTAENIGDATRYPVNAFWDDVALDPFIPDGGHLAALALVEIAAIEETAIRASWGSKPLVLSPTNFHSEAFAIIRPWLDGLVTSGGTPFGSTLTVSESHGPKRRGAIFNIAFLLPPGVDELLTPLSPFGARTPREILTRIALLGFKLKERSCSQEFSVWQRQVGNHTLLLETGFATQPTQVSLLSPNSNPVKIRVDHLNYTKVHPCIAGFLSAVVSDNNGEIPALFLENFKPCALKP